MTRAGEGTGDLLWFFGLTFAMTWVAFAVAGSLPVAEAAPNPIRELLFLPGTVAPAIVAVLLTARAQGRAGVKALLGQISRWRVSPRWYVFAISFMATVKLAGAVLHYAITGAWPRFGDTPLVVLLAAILVSTWVQAGEEVGWRGFALPRLAARLGLAWSSLVLGVIWAVWHLPLFIMPGIETSGQSFPLYLASVTALSVVFAWVYWQTGASLLLVMVLHASVNNSKYIVQSGAIPSAHPFTLHAPMLTWLTAALLWLAAAFVLRQMARASRELPPALDGPPLAAGQERVSWS